MIERRESAVWHPGLEFEDSTLQVSLFKDLAFLRNPSSPFTFFSFLREKELLYQYIHTNNLYPSRKLFSDYLVWVSHKFHRQISFGKEVTGIRYCGDQLGTPRFVVVVRDTATGSVSETVTDDLVLGLGHEPHIPENLAVDTDRVVHSNRFLHCVDEGRLKRDARVAVVGGGQSAGEIVRYLLRRPDVAEITVIGRRHLFTQTDDNPFVNDLYTYPRSLEFAGLPDEGRRRFLCDIKNTNFSSVTQDVLRDIYGLVFEDRTWGRDRLRLCSYTEIVSVGKNADGLRLEIKASGHAPAICDFDLLVCATGFTNNRHLKLLRPLGLGAQDRDIPVNGSFEVELDFPARPRRGLTGPRLFLMNHSLRTRGPTEHTLAGLAERAGVVADALDAGYRSEQPHEQAAYLASSSIFHLEGAVK